MLHGYMRVELACTARADKKTLCEMLGPTTRPNSGTVLAVCTVLGLTLPNVIVSADGED